MVDRWRLAAEVTLRPEAFGGLAFHRRRGITVEVDQEAYQLLYAYLAPRPLPAPGEAAARLVPQLVRLGVLCPADDANPLPARGPAMASPPWPGLEGPLSAPEVVHVAITTRCTRTCPGCYVPHVEHGQELDVAEWRVLIDRWAAMRVFQLAVGGGEPLLYKGLFDVLRYARTRGLVPNVTTNGALVDASVVRALERAGVARVNVSWNGSADDGGGGTAATRRALRCLLDSTMQVGVNLLVTPDLLPGLSEILSRIQALGVQQVTVLRPKPPARSTGAGRAWYDTNRLCRSDMRHLQQVLSAWRGVLRIEVGSALVGLMGDAGPGLLRRRGIYGCAAGRRTCTVWPDGRVTPCSFLADLAAGSVRQKPFDALWARGAGWAQLRDPDAQPGGTCAGCAVDAQCGGARCIARYERGDLLAGDEACPQTWREEQR